MIAPAEAGDEAAAVALWTAAGLTRPWNDAGADFRLALESGASTVLVARDVSGLAGTVMVGFDGHRGWLYYLAVRGDRRGGGLGRALVAAAEEWLAARGAPKVQLMVRADNRDAAFYARLGYEAQAVAVLGRRLDQSGLRSRS